MYYSSEENVLRIKIDKRIKMMKTIKEELVSYNIKSLNEKEQKRKERSSRR